MPSRQITVMRYLVSSEKSKITQVGFPSTAGPPFRRFRLTHGSALDLAFNCAYFCWSDHPKWRKDQAQETASDQIPHDPVGLLNSAIPRNAAEGAQVRPPLLPNGRRGQRMSPSHHWPVRLRAQELKLRLKVSLTAWFSAASRYFQL